MAVTEGAKTRTLKFGIAGLGVASTEILPNVAANAHYEVVAAAEPRPAGRERFEREYEGKAYETVEAMCDRPDLDAIYVCTPNNFHAQHVIAAAERGKHVIVEKPMAPTIDECEKMNEAADRYGIKLLCGHTHSFDPPIRKIRQIVASGELGKLTLINTLHYQDFMYRARMPQELDSSKGGNVVFNQGPHAIDIVRLIGGGLVRSVRAMTGIWDPKRRAEGAWAAFIEFEDGTPALNQFSGYAHWDTAEFTGWMGESPSNPEKNLRSRARIASFKSIEEEAEAKSQSRYGGANQSVRSHSADAPWAHFGITIVSCEHGDIRQSPHGLFIYGDEKNWEVPVEHGEFKHGRQAELDELYHAVVEDRPVFHDGRWGEATLEVVLAIMQSAKERREIMMAHQVPTPD
ncbi:MAG TPA: Gfo/Idh/MocA family oxidoreductase [Chloroflexota bacterium]